MSDKNIGFSLWKNLQIREKHAHYSVKYCLVSLSVYMINSSRDIQNNCMQIFYSCWTEAISLDIFLKRKIGFWTFTTSQTCL